MVCTQLLSVRLDVEAQEMWIGLLDSYLKMYVKPSPVSPLRSFDM
jgi:hypothetical protein